MTYSSAIRPPAMPTMSAEHLSVILDEYDRQTYAIQGQEVKSSYGMRQMLRVLSDGTLVTGETLMLLCAMDLTAELPEPYAEMWRSFLHDVIDELLNSSMNLMRIGARNIALEVERTLYVLPPEKRGLLWRLLFGDGG